MGGWTFPAVGRWQRVLAVALLVGALHVQAGEPARPVESGAQVYARWCVHCHDAGRGNPGTESLQVKYRGSVPAVLLERTDLTAEAVAVFVRQGILSMPPFRKTEITDAELKVLADYVARKAGGN